MTAGSSKAVGAVGEEADCERTGIGEPSVSTAARAKTDRAYVFNRDPEVLFMESSSTAVNSRRSRLCAEIEICTTLQHHEFDKPGETTKDTKGHEETTYTKENVNPQSTSFEYLRDLCGYFFVGLATNLASPDDLILRGREFFQREWPAAMQFLCADTHLRAEAEFPAIGKAS